MKKILKTIAGTIAPKTLSKKLTLAGTSVVFLILTELFDVQVDYETILGLVSIVVSYLVGQSIIDVKKENNKER